MTYNPADRVSLSQRLTIPPSPQSVPPRPEQTKGLVRRLLIYSTTATATFYVGSTFLSYENTRYHDFFTQNVPLANVLVDYGTKRGWDEITVQQVVVSTVDAVRYVSDFVQTQLGYRPKEDAAAVKGQDASDDIPRPPPRDRAKERVKSVASTLKTSVEKRSQEGTARARHIAAQFADELDELVRQAEQALKKAPEHEPPSTTVQQSPSDVELVIVEVKDHEPPLPIGFEQPPGLVRPMPSKPRTASVPPPIPAPTPKPLPLVAPTISGLEISEPAISHLAQTIDDLASYLSSTPAVSDKVSVILDTAKDDLQTLASRMEKIKKEEQHQLEQKLDQQAHEYNTKLLELEIEAQDKLDLQQEDFGKFLEEERARYAQTYREKLEHELRTQTELVNERWVISRAMIELQQHSTGSLKG